MSKQLQFGGDVPFVDRQTGRSVPVKVWGVLVGTGIDGHEEDAIRQWVLNALASSAMSYDGALTDLPARGAEWGHYVWQQIGPQLAQQFQVQGQLQIQGVALPDGMGAPVAAAAPAPAAKGGGLDPVALALVQRLGLPEDVARQAAAIAVEVMQGGGSGVTKAAYGQPAKHAEPVKQSYAQPAKHAEPVKQSYAQPAKHAEPVKQSYAQPAKHAEPVKHAEPTKQSYAQPAKHAEPSKQSYGQPSGKESWDKGTK